MKQFSLFSLLSLTLCFTSCRDFKDLECTGVSGFTINKINTDGINADIKLKIKNPNSIGFSIYKSEADISYSGIYLGKAKIEKRIYIAAFSEENYSVNLNGDFKDINIADIIKLLGTASVSRLGVIEVKGNIYAGKFLMKRKFPVDVKERIGLH